MIHWHFIPPHSPNFGGLWEAAVKRAKYHIKRIVDEARLTFEELYTVITQIEAIMNPRPLIPMSNDPNDIDFLTPGHFLIGEPFTAIPQTSVVELPTNQLNSISVCSSLLNISGSDGTKNIYHPAATV